MSAFSTLLSLHQRPIAPPPSAPFMISPISQRTLSDNESAAFRRYFHWKKKIEEDDDADNDEEVLTFSATSHACDDADKEKQTEFISTTSLALVPRKKAAVSSKLRSALALTLFGKRRSHLSSGLGTKVIGTLFGNRRGHVHFAFQEDPKSHPAFLMELATTTSILVREMASGLVRIALECDKKAETKKGTKLLEEPLWRTYCNGKKCGYAVKRECGAEEWKVLKAVEPISMGAGVLPAGDGETGSEGELMYMRAKFERVVGSKDSEAFYMMNPDGTGGPELSIYLLRV